MMSEWPLMYLVVEWTTRRSPGQGALAIGRGEGVVDDRQQAARACQGRDGLQIGQLQQRIGGAFHPEHAGRRANDRLQHGQVAGVDVAEIQVGRAAADGLEEAIRPAVEIVAHDDVRAVVQQLERGGNGRQPGREGEGRLAVFQVGQAAFEGEAGGILRAAVIEALVDPRRLLHVGAADGDWHHDGAGGRVGRLAGMDRSGAERRPPGGPEGCEKCELLTGCSLGL